MAAPTSSHHANFKEHVDIPLVSMYLAKATTTTTHYYQHENLHDDALQLRHGTRSHSRQPSNGSFLHTNTNTTKIFLLAHHHVSLRHIIILPRRSNLHSTQHFHRRPNLRRTMHRRRTENETCDGSRQHRCQ